MIVIVAFIGAVGTIVAAIITTRHGTNKKLDEIHVLVNARLTAALEEISNLRDYINAQQGVEDPSKKLVPPVIPHLPTKDEWAG